MADQETISANAREEEGRGQDRGGERGGEVNGREIEKGWNDRETTERGEDDGETERKDKEGVPVFEPDDLVDERRLCGASLSREGP